MSVHPCWSSEMSLVSPKYLFCYRSQLGTGPKRTPCFAVVTLHQLRFLLCGEDRSMGDSPARVGHSIVFCTDLGLFCIWSLQQALSFTHLWLWDRELAVAISLFSSSVGSMDKECFREYDVGPLPGSSREVGSAVVICVSFVWCDRYGGSAGRNAEL